MVAVDVFPSRASTFTRGPKMKPFRQSLTVVTSLVILGSVRASGQRPSPLHPGGWIISGGASVGRSHDNLTDDDVTHIALQPTGLVFVTSHLAIGGSVPLAYTRDPAGHTYLYGVGPSARYYFTADSARWLPFVAAAVTSQWQKLHRAVTNNGVSTTIDTDVRYTTVDGSAGLTRLVAEHVGLTGELYYSRSQFRDDFRPGGGTRRMYDLGARFGLTVFVH
jgi:hypothetical protein